MATTTATLLILALLAPTTACAAETDPARRSLVVEAVERARPAVVNISAEQVVEYRRSPFSFPQNPFFDEFFRDFFDPRPQRSTRTSLGSGAIVDTDGTILTAEHVILRGSRIHVTLADGREFEARLVGSDADSDLAVLHIDTDEPLPTIPMGRSDDLLIGETVIAIGNPFELSHTVTTGVVSALGRSLRKGERTYTDFIQTDASINPGNSGGPLLNTTGELIGINTAIYDKAQGIGFAIPVDRARRVMRELVSYGEVRRGWVGLVVQDLTPALAEHFGVKRGVVVAAVEPHSPAGRAGIERGEVITRVDGQTVTSREDFAERSQARAVGERLALTVRRDGRDTEVGVVVGTFSATDADELAWTLLGIRVREDKAGLAVSRVRRRGPAAEIGVEPGDRLLGLGGAQVDSLQAFRRRMVEVRRARSVLLSVGRGPYQYNVPLTLDRGQRS